MVHVSLIPLVPVHAPWPSDRIAAIRAELERAGYAVALEGAGPADRVPPRELVAAVVDRLRAATGRSLVVVDLAMAYAPADVLAVARRLDAGDCDLALAARAGRRTGPIARRLLGASDPATGLVGLTRAAADAAGPAFAPVGDRFACELLARVGGRRADVPVARVAAPGRRWIPLDDVRHAKRIADERLGNVSRLLQFCFVGASGMVVDLATYALLLATLGPTGLADRVLYRGVGGSPINLAGVVAAVLAIAVAMTWNFALNRRLTFNDARGGSIGRQYARYALSNLAGIGVSLTCRLLLPGSIGFFARHRLVAAVAGIVAATGLSFSLSRWFVFGDRPRRGPCPAPPASRVDPGHEPDVAAPHRGLAHEIANEVGVGCR